MAEETKKLSPSESYDLLVAQVHAPVFFQKLASVWGFQPANDQEAKELLQLAGSLRNAHEQELQKKASEQTSAFAQARQDINKTISNLGFQPLADNDTSIKQAASAAVQNPLIKEAALTFHQYLTQTINAN